MAVDTSPNQTSIPAGEKWDRFVRSKMGEHPDVGAGEHMQQYNDFAAFVKKIDPSASAADLWIDVQGMHTAHPAMDGHEQAPHEDSHEDSSHSSSHAAGGGGDLFSFFKKPKFMEEDPKFWKLREEIDNAWKKENPHITGGETKEIRLAYDEKYADFIYGSVDDKNGESLDQKAAKKFEEKYKDTKELEKYKTYRKTPLPGLGGKHSFDKDHEIGFVSQNIAREGSMRYSLLQRKGLKGTELDQSYAAVMQRIRQRRWNEFFEKHPEKTKAYTEVAYTNKDKHAQELFKEFSEAHTVWKEEQKQQAVAADEGIVHEHQQAPQPITEADKAPAVSQVEHVATPAATHPAIPKTPSPSAPKPTTQGKKQQGAVAHAILSQFATQQQSDDRGQQNMLSQGIDRINSAVDTYRSSKDFFNFGKTLLRGNPLSSGAATTTGGEGALLAEGGIATQGAALAGVESAGALAAGGAAAEGAAVAGGALAAGEGAAATGGTVAFLASPPGWVVLAVIGILLLIIIVFVIIMMLFNQQNSQATPQTIPGLTLILNGPTEVPNSTDIQYRIVASYTGTNDITLTDQLPADTSFVSTTGIATPSGSSVSWRLNDNTATGTSPKTYLFTITLRPQKEDINVVNKIIATAAGIGGGGPVLIGGSGNACTQPHEGTGYCSVENLKQYFGGDGSKALIASMICQDESGSNPNALNTNCGTNDYSVGLYQINLVAHCEGAYAGLSCNNLINIGKRNTCEVKYKNPEGNITYMLGLSQGGTKWSAWSTWGRVQTRLASCGVR